MCILINSEGRLETRVLRERRRKIASELAHTFLYQIMVNMTFVPKIIFDICKRFFQLGHFTCDHLAEAVASSQSTTDSTTLDYSTTDSTTPYPYKYVTVIRVLRQIHTVRTLFCDRLLQIR